MEYKDYYKILDVSKDADNKTIKRAYRQLARKYHPDKNPGDKKAEETFKEINEAYEVLGDPDNRAKYDRLGRNYHRYQQMGGNAADFDFSQWFGGAAGGQQGRVHVDFGDLFGGGGGFSDFFTSIFGGAAARSAAGQSMRQEDLFGNVSGQSSSLDINQTIDITLEEAYRGTSRKVLQNGTQFTTKIPAGAKTGTKVRLRGKGNVGPNGQGDLYLVVNVLPHDTFQRVGNNLRLDVTVDVVTAVLGGKTLVPTLDGQLQLTIPPGTQGGQVIRLKGKGMPYLRDKTQSGDLLARVRISIPTDIDDKQRRLYQQLAELQ
ncbi:MAG: J domain-containing protein [Candidatus Promineifilaceae bacterium]|nr:J domain-containing protein [Candidatus Promineifilaceae bacterium]